MRHDLTDITMVIDRSGSMHAIQSDAEGGINAFIQQQKQEQEAGETVLTLVQFNTTDEVVHRGVPVLQVPTFQLKPSGSTALLDAVGQALLDTGARLEAIEESHRPGLVIFVIVTDGLENASRRFTREQIRGMIRHQQAAYRWQFTFLAANQDAFAEGESLGIAQEGIANYAQHKVRETCNAFAQKVTRMKQAAQNNSPLDNRFTPEELADMN
jgi:hypothetical protein